MLRIDLFLFFSLEFCFFAYCMKKYSIEVTEILSHIVEIMANDEEEAIRIVKAKYQNCDIVLDASDYVSTKIGVCDE